MSVLKWRHFALCEKCVSWNHPFEPHNNEDVAHLWQERNRCGEMGGKKKIPENSPLYSSLDCPWWEWRWKGHCLQTAAEQKNTFPWCDSERHETLMGSFIQPRPTEVWMTLSHTELRGGNRKEGSSKESQTVQRDGLTPFDSPAFIGHSSLLLNERGEKNSIELLKRWFRRQQL